MSELNLIREEFSESLGDIRFLIGSDAYAKASRGARVASANASVLIISATFEEFIRQMAKAYSLTVTNRAERLTELPPSILAFVWKASLEEFAREKFDISKNHSQAMASVAKVKGHFSEFERFLNGDHSIDIIKGCLKNINNMRAGEINRLFKICGRSDICKTACAHHNMLEFFGVSDANKAHGFFLSGLEAFYDRRNDVAHALDPRSSVGTTIIENDISMLEAFATALQDALSE